MFYLHKLDFKSLCMFFVWSCVIWIYIRFHPASFLLTPQVVRYFIWVGFTLKLSKSSDIGFNILIWFVLWSEFGCYKYNLDILYRKEYREMRDCCFIEANSSAQRYQCYNHIPNYHIWLITIACTTAMVTLMTRYWHSRPAYQINLVICKGHETLKIKVQSRFKNRDQNFFLTIFFFFEIWCG